MKTNACRNKFEDDVLAIKLTDRLEMMTEEFSFVLPRGWRFIAKIVKLSTGIRDELFYLDLQADEGGGSWAEAKIKTMEVMDLAATQPIDRYLVVDWIRNSGLYVTRHGKEICDAITSGEVSDVNQLDRDSIHWLVNVANGPGIAPNFGGLSLNAECRFFKKSSDASLSSKRVPCTETDMIEVAFSGAAAWQDLQFATSALNETIQYLDGLPDESFKFNLKPLEEIPEVHFLAEELRAFQIVLSLRFWHAIRNQISRTR